jgi:hypothetical protein
MERPDELGQGDDNPCNCMGKGMMIRQSGRLLPLHRAGSRGDRVQTPRVRISARSVAASWGRCSAATVYPGRP